MSVTGYMGYSKDDVDVTIETGVILPGLLANKISGRDTVELTCQNDTGFLM
ncbi:MAG: hypothetical protein ABFC71_03305 [Methanoregula sp.]